MRLFTFLILLLITSRPLYAAEPIVIIGQLPSDQQLELYEDSENLFAMKVMEYYQAAVVLRTQLYLLGNSEARPVFPPTLEELEEMDIAVIKKFYRIAKTFQDEVLAYPESKIVELKEENIRLNRLILQEKIDALDKYWDKSKDSYEDKINLIQSINEDCDERLNRIARLFEKQNGDLVTILSVSVSENLFLNNNGQKIENDPSLSVRLNLNLYKILGFWQGLDIWYEYASPRIKTVRVVRGMPDYDLREEWNSNMHSVGISGRIRPIIHGESYSDGFKLGLGYFWANGYIYNRTGSYFNWSAVRGDIEYFAGNFTSKLPIELFAALSIYHSFNNEMMLYINNPGTSIMNLSRTQFGISLGLRYNFWRTAY